MRRVTVFGAGRSGVAAANFLVRRDVGVQITDAKPEPELPLAANLDPRVSRQFGSHPESLLEQIDAIVLSPGIPKSIPILRAAADRGIPILSEIELAFRHLKGRVVAITGSNGKSTTTALIGAILDEARIDNVVAGNIGEPLIAHVSDEWKTYVIELSSFQLETVDRFRANVALLLNITPDHLDRYASMDEYAAAKKRIFRNQTEEDVAIVNADDERTAVPPTAAKTWRFSSSGPIAPGAFFDGERLHLTVNGAEAPIERSGLALAGLANVENALAAWLAAKACGAPGDAVRRAFARFRGLPHRMVVVRELDGVRWINDSKGTNVDATLKSLEGLPDGSVILILGGKDKGDDFSRMRNLVTKKARLVITIGAAAEKVGEGLRGAAEILEGREMERATRLAHEEAREGDTILLSPACASFDQYGNFEERGRHFESLVASLASKGKVSP
jgi:UDP-N-acetylmuramoylalanine--D-glutamate ligase